MADNGTVFVAAAFRPEPPLLHPEVLGAGQDMAGPFRSACSDALGRVLAAEPEAIMAAARSARGQAIERTDR